MYRTRQKCGLCHEVGHNARRCPRRPAMAPARPIPLVFRPPPPAREGREGIERTFAAVEALFDRVISDRWDHRSLGRVAPNDGTDL